MKEYEKISNKLQEQVIFGDYVLIRISIGSGGHGGGNTRLQDQIFKEMPAPLHLAAGSGNTTHVL